MLTAYAAARDRIIAITKRKTHTSSLHHVEKTVSELLFLTSGTVSQGATLIVALTFFTGH